jgi:hypothetical protein
VLRLIQTAVHRVRLHVGARGLPAERRRDELRRSRLRERAARPHRHARAEPLVDHGTDEDLGAGDHLLHEHLRIPSADSPSRGEHRLRRGRDRFGAADVDPNAAQLRLVGKFGRHRLDRDGRADLPGGLHRLRRGSDQGLLRPAHPVQLQDPCAGGLVEGP